MISLDWTLQMNRDEKEEVSSYLFLPGLSFSGYFAC